MPGTNMGVAGTSLGIKNEVQVGAKKKCGASRQNLKFLCPDHDF